MTKSSTAGISSMDLVKMNPQELHALLMRGHAIDEQQIENYEFKGFSLGLPAWVNQLTWKKFKKVFHRDPQSGHLRGWNIKLDQNDLKAPSVATQKNGKDITYGHYRVVSIKNQKMPWQIPAGLMIDYGLGGNGAFGIFNLLKDPMVAVNRGSSDLILGYMFLKIGPLRIRIPGFFSLERECALAHPVEPPNPSSRDIPPQHGSCLEIHQLTPLDPNCRRTDG